MFSSRSFIVSDLTFRFLIHFEYILCMVLESYLVLFFLGGWPIFPAPLVIKIVFLHCIFLTPLSKIRCPKVCGFISGLSVLFLWSRFVSLCQYHTVLMTVALYYSLKSGRFIPPVSFFFLKFALDILGFLYFHTNCEIICFSSVKNTLVAWKGLHWIYRLLWVI